VIAIDTNILVYAHRTDSPHFPDASRRLKELAESRAAWAIPWPCLNEFYGVVTHPRIYRPPSSIAEALAQIEIWLESPALVVLSEADGYLDHLRGAVTAGAITGPRVHDARIVAICRQHSVRELWSADRDFSRFQNLRVVNPLLQ
jgi:toxin-antitoxin system PIN domain toxin